MDLDKEKLQDVIDNLNVIQEYSHITYPQEDNEKAKEILNNIYELTEKWIEMHNDNYSY